MSGNPKNGLRRTDRIRKTQGAMMFVVVRGQYEEAPWTSAYLSRNHVFSGIRGFQKSSGFLTREMFDHMVSTIVGGSSRHSSGLAYPPGEGFGCLVAEYCKHLEELIESEPLTFEAFCVVFG